MECGYQSCYLAFLVQSSGEIVAIVALISLVYKLTQLVSQQHIWYPNIISDKISAELSKAIDSHSEAEIVEIINGTDITTVTQVEDYSTTLAGRLRFPVWDYFIYDKTKDKSVCQCMYKEHISLAVVSRVELQKSVKWR